MAHACQEVPFVMVEGLEFGDPEPRNSSVSRIALST